MPSRRAAIICGSTSPIGRACWPRSPAYLGRHGISIASVIQHDAKTAPRATVPLVIMTHRTHREGADRSERLRSDRSKLACARPCGLRRPELLRMRDVSRDQRIMKYAIIIPDGCGRRAAGIARRPDAACKRPHLPAMDAVARGRRRRPGEPCARVAARRLGRGQPEPAGLRPARALHRPRSAGGRGAGHRSLARTIGPSAAIW